MLIHLEDARAFHSAYAPALHVLGARVARHDDRLDPRPILVAGKGLTVADAELRLCGEAAERDATAMRHGDRLRHLIDGTGARLGTIPAAQMLSGTRTAGLGSTGCAAHNLMKLAIQSAIHELIERRAVKRWWTRDISATALFVSAPPPAPLAAFEHKARLGSRAPRDTCFFRLNEPGPLHVVAARSATRTETSRPTRGYDQITVAFAAGPNLVATCERALLELLSLELETSDLHAARQAGETITRNSMRGLVAARQHAFATSHADLFEMPEFTGTVDATQALSNTGLLKAYGALGLDISLADLTRPDTGLPVCRAFFTDRALQPKFSPGFELSPV